MIKKITIICGLLFSLCAMSCGSSDSSDNEEEVPLLAPKVVSMTPANGTTGIEMGTVAVSVTYDQAIILVSSKVSQINISGGSLSGPTVNDKTLSFTVTCPFPNRTVTIKVPKGVIISTTGTAADALELSFTTKEGETNVEEIETAAQAVLNMAPGWNLGNTLDSYGNWIGNNLSSDKYETAWGQPLTDAHLMAECKKKGFKAIRVPVTWYQHMNQSGKVDESWMNRVQEIVDYVINAGMYCIVNVHHDTGAHDDSWIRANSNVYTKNHERYEYLWKQIAERFQNYGKQLLFEGYNEMLDNNNTWTQPKNINDLQYTNSFAQGFVNAVRSTGGNNFYRNLVVNTYSGAHTKNVLSGLVIPTDPCGNQRHIAVEVHSYDPWDWVNTYNMTWTEACTKELEYMFTDLNTYIIQKGYPVIVGEYGTNGNNEKTINASSTDAQKAEAGRQAGDMNRLCKKYKAASFYWMGLIDGKDRSEATFKWTMEQVADSIINVYK